MVIDSNLISNTASGAQNKSNTVDRGKTATSNTGTTSPASTGSQSKDSVSLSPEAQKLQSLQSAVATADASNPDKVQAIKASLASGTYEVSAQSVADKMLAALES